MKNKNTFMSRKKKYGEMGVSRNKKPRRCHWHADLYRVVWDDKVRELLR